MKVSASVFCLIGVLIGPGTAPLTNLRGHLMAAPPQAPPPRPIQNGPPSALLSFAPGIQTYSLTLEMTVVGQRDKSLNLPIYLSSSVSARNLVFIQLTRLGWSVEKAGENTLIIHGSDKPKAIIKTCKLTIRALDDEKLSLAQPTITGVGGVSTEPGENTPKLYPDEKHPKKKD